jgi:hypothetical protein
MLPKSAASPLFKRLVRDGNKGYVELEDDVEAVIENNKRLQNEPQDKKSSFRHVASIPNIFINQWLNEEYARGNVGIKLFGPEMDALVARKLKDPDWKWLRTDK